MLPPRSEDGGSAEDEVAAGGARRPADVLVLRWGLHGCAAFDLAVTCGMRPGQLASVVESGARPAADYEAKKRSHLNRWLRLQVTGCPTPCASGKTWRRPSLSGPATLQLMSGCFRPGAMSCGQCSGGPQKPRGWASTWQILEDAAFSVRRGTPCSGARASAPVFLSRGEPVTPFKGICIIFLCWV